MIRTGGRFILSFLLCTIAVVANAQREVVSLDGEWLFYDPMVNDTVSVQVPHSWEYDAMTSYPRMPKEKTCTYIKTIDVGSYADKRLLLKFDGVNKTAVVKIDNVEVGRHTGGYTAFYIDITDAVKGKRKVSLTVDVTNVDYVTMPLSADFTQYAGIYRDVCLVLLNPEVSFSNQDAGSDGVYLNYTLDGHSVSLTPTVMLDSKEKGLANIVTVIKDATGRIVNVDKQDFALDGTATQKITFKKAIRIDNIHLWSGMDDPYLYTAVVKVKYKGEEVDKVTQKIGFRTIEISDGLFFLNGKQYKVRGVGMHQDQSATTNVSTPEQRESDINTVIEMGANALRASHYPHNQHIYELCDEKGLIVWCEIPFSTVMVDKDSFRTNALQVAEEMVRQNVNHPSIIVWGIANEVREFDWAASYSECATKEQIDATMIDIAAAIKKIDGSRMVGSAVVDGEEKMRPSPEAVTKGGPVNVIGFNIYRGWYSKIDGATETHKMTSIAESCRKAIAYFIKGYRKTSGNTLSFVMTEYGAGANTEQHSDLGSDFLWNCDDSYKPTGNFHPEEYQSYVHEGMYIALYGDKTNRILPPCNIWGSFAWCMFDFSCYRDEGGHLRLNDKGFVTADRKTKKDAFYFYKANWNKTDLFTHICSSRCTERNGSITIKVYSNCESVELTVNGRNLGAGTKIQDCVFVWTDVRLKMNNNSVVSRGTCKGSSKAYRDECKTWIVPDPARETVSLDGEWLFTDPEADSPETVQVPHSWDAAQPDGTIFAARTKTCTYEKTIDLSEYPGKRLLLEFEGVNKIAVIKVDGDSIASHVGGFSTFYVDITEAARGKSQVTLGADVTNYDKKTMPARCDFTHFGGIYRDVHLVAVNPKISISNSDFGSKGLYLPYSIKGNVVRLSPSMVFDSAVRDSVIVKVAVRDAEGNDVACTEQTLKLDSAMVQNRSLNTIILSDIHLWNGVKDPYLYTVDVQVYHNGSLIDEVSDKVGFRTYKIRDNKFYLNGKQYELRGVGMHQDYGATTNVTTPEQREDDVNTALEMGANALRLVHYPHNQHTYSLCDEKGIVVWCELAFVSNMIELDSFKNNGIQCAREMVKQCMNHPSIIVWSIENEVDYKLKYVYMLPNQSTAEQIAPYMKKLSKVVREIDPSRIVGETVQNNATYLKDTASWTTKDSGIGVTGFNLYIGWYDTVRGATESKKKKLVNLLKNKIALYTDTIRSASENRASCLMTEFGAGANVNHHCTLGSNFVWGAWNGDVYYNQGGQFHPEEYQSYVHEVDYMAIYGDKTNNIAACDIWASFTWALFDFSTYRNEGGIPRLNDKGLITADRQTKKDAFYLYKANWNKTDYFTHICSSRYIERKDTITVKVYSNCESVELIVNGRNLGAGKKTQDGVFKWKNVILGENNTVIAKGFNGGTEVCSDECDAWTTTTGVIEIEAPAAGNADASTYNLAGQRVNGTAKGILIRQGRKFVSR